MPGGILSRRVNPRVDSPFDRGVSTPELRVQANPVDPYAKPEVSLDSVRVLQALTGLVENGGKVAQIGAQEARAKGARDFLSKEAVVSQKAVQVDGNKRTLTTVDGVPKTTKEVTPTGIGAIFSSAYMSGYDKMAGEADANKYKAELQTLLTDAEKGILNLSQADFQKKLDELRQRYIMGASGSEDHLDAFLGKASPVEENAHLVYAQHQTTLARNAFQAKTVANFRQSTTEWITQGLASIGISNFEELNTVEGIKKLTDNSATFSKAIGQRLRDELSIRQEQLKGTFSKPEVTAMQHQIIQEIATQYGIPELLSYADLPDKDKVAVRDTFDLEGKPLEPRIGNAAAEAERVRNVRMEQARVLKERTEKHTRENAYVSLVSLANQAYKADNPLAHLAAVEQAWESFKNLPGITADEYNTLWNVVENAKKQGEHPVYATPGVTEQLWRDFGFGNLTVNKVLEKKRDLPLAEYNAWLGRAGQEAAERHKVQREGTDAYFTPKKITELHYDGLKKVIDPEEAGFHLNLQGPEQLKAAQTYYESLMVAHYGENGGRSPSFQETLEIEKKVLAKYPPYDIQKDIAGSKDIKGVSEDIVKNGGNPADFGPDGFPATRTALAKYAGKYSGEQRKQIARKLAEANK